MRLSTNTSRTRGRSSSASGTVEQEGFRKQFITIGFAERLIEVGSYINPASPQGFAISILQHDVPDYDMTDQLPRRRIIGACLRALGKEQVEETESRANDEEERKGRTRMKYVLAWYRFCAPFGEEKLQEIKTDAYVIKAVRIQYYGKMRRA